MRILFSLLIVLSAWPAVAAPMEPAPEAPWREHLRRSQELSEEGNYRDALALMSKALSESESAFGPDDEGTIRYLGEKAYLHWMLGEGEEVRRALSRLSSAGPKNFQARIQLGRLHLLRREFAPAERYLEECYRLRPGDGELAVQRGRLFAATGRPDRAAGAFEVAVRRDPGNYWLYGELGRCYALIGRKDLMAQTYERARKHAAGDMHHYVVLGYSYLKMGDSAKALQAFEEAAALGSDNPSGYRHLGSYYQSIGRTSEAAANYERLLVLFEKRPERTSVDLLHVTDQLAEIYLSDNKPAYAESVARRVLKLKGHINGDLWTAIFPHAADIYARLGRGADVDRLFAEEIQAAEERPIDRLYLIAEHARSSWRLNDQGRSRALIRRFESGAAGSLNPASFEDRSRLALALNTVAEVSWELGDKLVTERLYGKSLALWPRWERRFEIITAIRGLAHCYLAQDKRDDARRILEKAVDDFASEPPAHFDDLDVSSQQEDDLVFFIDELTKLYRRMGQEPKAQALAKRARALEAEGRLKRKEKTASTQK